MPHFPMFVDLSGRPVLIVGGGKIGYYLAGQLLRLGMRVRILPETDGAALLEAFFSEESPE